MGYENHRWFMLYSVAGFACLTTVGFLQLMYLSIRSSRGEGLLSTKLVLVGLALSMLFSFFTGCIMATHVYLGCVRNVTTNEHINAYRYEHFREPETGMLKKHSPFHRGKWQRFPCGAERGGWGGATDRRGIATAAPESLAPHPATHLGSAHSRVRAGHAAPACVLRGWVCMHSCAGQGCSPTRACCCT